MAIQFLNIPQPKVPGPLDFSPLQNSLDQFRKSIDRSHEMEQNRLLGGAIKEKGYRGGADVAFEQGRNDIGVDLRQAADVEDRNKVALRDRAKMKVAGLAQAILEAPEEQRAAMWNKVRALDPDGDNELRAAGIDPNDYNAGARMLIAEARGYQDPLDRQIKEAQLANYRRQAGGDQVYTQRAAAAQRYGLDPNSDAGRRFILTGEMPKSLGATLTAGQTQVDKKFADDYLSWKVGGGAADTQKQLAQLDGIADLLEDPERGKYVTGPVEALMPDSISALTPTGQTRVATREAVEEVVQRNLRLVLGAQFTEGEGNRLIARAYNPALPPAENARRVRRLVTQIQNAAKAKQDAAEYFERNGTLAGWNGRLPSIEDFNPEGTDQPSGGGGAAVPPPSAAPPVPSQDPSLRGRVRNDIRLTPDQLPQVLQEAREAIQRGADPNVVRQRLIENGVDPGGL
jgi:hypothetical protein